MQIAPIAQATPRRPQDSPLVAWGELPKWPRQIALADTIAGQIIPRLVRSHPPTLIPQDRVAQGRGHFEPANVEAFARALRTIEDLPSELALSGLLARGAGWQALCLEIMGPAARLLGQWWESDECDFTEVTLAIGRLQRLLRAFAPTPVGVDLDAGRRLLLAPAPGEQHTFGLSVVGDVFRQSGWDVQVQLETDGQDVLLDVGQGWFDAAGFTVAAEERLGALTALIKRVREASINPRLCIMAGGSLFLQRPDLLARVGVDVVVEDVGQAPALADRMVAARSLSRVGSVPARKM